MQKKKNASNSTRQYSLNFINFREARAEEAANYFNNDRFLARGIFIAHFSSSSPPRLS
jgi:hypothetical protein